MSFKEWKEYKLGELAKSKWGFVDGPFGSNLPASDYTEIGIPVIRGVNLSKGLQRFKDDRFIFVSEATAKRLERSKCYSGDIIFTKKGTLGQIGIIPKGAKYKEYLLSSNQMKLTVNNEIVDNEYVYYYLSSKISIEKIIQDSEHTGVPKINLSYLKGFPIKLPILSSQKNISLILSSLDDKIELNRQTNQTLEAIAQTLFKEMCVPKAKELPKGWEVKKLSELGDFKNGINYSRDENGDTEFSIVNVRDVVNSKFLLKNNLSKISINKKKASPYLLEVDDIVIVRSASPGETAILFYPEKDIIYSGFTIRYRINNKSHFLYYFFIFQSIKHQLDNLSNGTTLKNVNQEMLKSYQIILPDEKTILKFNNSVEPIYQLVLTNLQENQTLINTRDSLLPKLMKGEIKL